MRIDIVVGVTVSGLIHAGLFLGGILYPNHPARPKPAAPADAVQLFDLPRIEPEKPDVVETPEDTPKPIDFVPKMQPDVPQPTTDTSFIQQLQPPLPEGVKPTTGLLVIPPDSRNQNYAHLTVFDPAMLDQQPIARVRTPPQYPFEMQRQGVSGEVTVDFIVDANGDVLNAVAVRSSQRDFEAAAVQAVGKWKFKPGKKGGHAVNTHMQVPVIFTLND